MTMKRVKSNFTVYFSATILAFAISVLGVNSLWGQGATATILGTVTDMSGAAVPDAMVQVKNSGTGATQSLTSDAQGRYRVPDLALRRIRNPGL